MMADELAAWPFPGDSPVVRARRVALAYRARLAEVDPAGCALIDKRVNRWGQSWAAPSEHFDLDDWISARDAARLASVQVSRIGKWRRAGRLPGRLCTRLSRTRLTAASARHTWEYQVRDVLNLSTSVRARGKRRDHDGH
jgi:hypothetical protein